MKKKELKKLRHGDKDYTAASFIILPKDFVEKFGLTGVVDTEFDESSKIYILNWLNFNMTYYILSDIHLEFHIDNLSISNEDIDKIIGRYFEVADNILFAGDAGNDIKTQIRLYEYLSWKYKNVYIVFGNHDLCYNKNNTSENRILEVKKYLPKNVYLLNGNSINNISGTMGMCDFDKDHTPYDIFKWKQWFDGTHWNYMDMNPYNIKKFEINKLNVCIKSKPNIIMTHYIPEQAGINEQYINDPFNKYFIFNANEQLEMIEKDTYWIYGHTHNKRISSYINKIKDYPILNLYYWKLPYNLWQ